MTTPTESGRAARQDAAIGCSPPRAAAPAVLGCSLLLLVLAPRTPVAPQPVVARAFIDPSSSPVEELMLLPGIGERRAMLIDRHRQEHGAFEAPPDLLDVRGIGPRTLRLMEPWLVFDRDASTPPESRR